jgi:ribose 5-phosphate isomerase B
MNFPKRVVLAADHAGFSLKEIIKQHCIQQKVDVVDVGTFSEEPDDYPAIIRKGCAAVLEYNCLGIVIGGSGNGEAIAANKVHGIRCALCYSKETAALARQHNNANVLSLGARLLDADLAKELVDIFLTTDFEGGRHAARVEDLE